MNMTPQRFQEAETVLEHLEKLSPEQQKDYFRALEMENSTLYQDVVSLLDAEANVLLPHSPVAPQAKVPVVSRGDLLGGRYEVIRQIGKGGMGSVFLARDLTHNMAPGHPGVDREADWGERLIAIKIAGPGLGRAFLDKEAEVLRRLHHPHLPRVWDKFAEAGQTYLVMDYIPGQSLWEWLGKRPTPFSQEQVLAWVRIVLDVLDYLHVPRTDRVSESDLGQKQQGVKRRTGELPIERRGPIIHRDIKPANLVLTDYDGLYVVDLGIARTGVANLTVKVSSSRSLGTPGYAPPEVEETGGVPVPQSDLYGLGMTAAVLLTKSKPTELTVQRRKSRLQHGAPDPLRTVLDGAHLDDGLKQWILRATELDVEDRFPSAAAMLAGLKDVERSVRATKEVERSVRALETLKQTALVDQAASVSTRWSLRSLITMRQAGYVSVFAIFLSLLGIGLVQLNNGGWPFAPGEQESIMMDASEQVRLGIMHANAVPPEDEEAVRFFELATDQDYAPGQANLGRMYLEGRGGLTQSTIEAMRLFRLAVAQGDPTAQLHLGFIYANGIDVPPNDPEAVRLYTLAAEQEFAPGQTNLGLMYLEGRGGLTQSYEQAEWLFRLAANQKHAPAQFNLGLMYLEGRGGLRPSYEQAERLFRLAADQGYEPALDAIRRLGM